MRRMKEGKPISGLWVCMNSKHTCFAVCAGLELAALQQALTPSKHVYSRLRPCGAEGLLALCRYNNLVQYMRYSMPSTHIVLVAILPRAGWTLPDNWAYPNRFSAPIDKVNSHIHVRLLLMHPAAPGKPAPLMHG